MSISNQTWFFVFALRSVPTDGITCVCTMTSTLLITHACNRQKYWPFLLCATYWDESISCMGVVSSVCACFSPCWISSYCASFSTLRSSCSTLSFRCDSYNSFISSILYLSLFLWMILLSHYHLLASISKDAFITSGSTLSFHLFSASALPRTFWAIQRLTNYWNFTMHHPSWPGEY